MTNKLLGALFDDLGFREGPEGCHGDCGHKNIQVIKRFCGELV